ncbi:Ribosomal protein S30, partial [Operophtera brumata]
TLKMQLHIRGQSTHVLDVNGEESIGQIKERVRALAGVNDEDLTLSVCGAPLEDSCLVSELSCSELDLTIPLLGGKVHGSLARAGKYIHRILFTYPLGELAYLTLSSYL